MFNLKYSFEEIMMEIFIPKYNSSDGVEIVLEDDHDIECFFDNRFNEVVIRANAIGMFSFARILLQLAQDEVPEGETVHLDENIFSNNNAVRIVIKKCADAEVQL